MCSVSRISEPLLRCGILLFSEYRKTGGNLTGHGEVFREYGDFIVKQSGFIYDDIVEQTGGNVIFRFQKSEGI